MNKLNHVAFIMDGNGRWGKRRKKGRNFGHLKGVEIVEKIVKCSIKLKIKFDTRSKLVMINNHVNKELMFNKSYPYRSSKSKLVEKLFRELSKKIKMQG